MKFLKYSCFALLFGLFVVNTYITFTHPAYKTRLNTEEVIKSQFEQITGELRTNFRNLFHKINTANNNTSHEAYNSRYQKRKKKIWKITEHVNQKRT